TELQIVIQENQLRLDSQQQSLLEQYARLLAEWNEKINLISRKDTDHILDRHIFHSLVLAMPAICDYDFRDKRVLDIGTGGGLPGIPLKIAVPTLDITLVDSTQKKIMAVNEMISAIGLTGIRAIAARVEEFAKVPEHSHAYNAIVSRAVAPLEDMAKWSRGLLKPGGVLFSLKGGDLSEEINRTKRLKFVAHVAEKPLDLIGYPDFQRDEKKLVRVDFNK
ncbi:MAG: 16S rRNA (guanine(527)-N(7))-methyltransferase RsmG, partial [Bacteroidota bacterium]|nr:16S rRNA (guanine(527)-N(7))-methyltransferase RsmG [Bacteroidota bacterium]